MLHDGYCCGSLFLQYDCCYMCIRTIISDCCRSVSVLLGRLGILNTFHALWASICKLPSCNLSIYLVFCWRTVRRVSLKAQDSMSTRAGEEIYFLPSLRQTIVISSVSPIFNPIKIKSSNPSSCYGMVYPVSVPNLLSIQNIQLTNPMDKIQWSI